MIVMFSVTVVVVSFLVFMYWLGKGQEKIEKMDIDKEEYKIAEHKIIETPTEFNVGKAKILYRFEDGRELEGIIYGNVTQRCTVEYGWSKAESFSAQERLEIEARKIEASKIATVYDDVTDIKKVYWGKLLSIEIMEIEDYVITYDVKSYEEIKNND